ncbi:outer membrane lipid asymmetry maintenance protein MlaD [Frigidibacter sp.]|uniref:outer membrane lipid asymmetry maintenance protein MlaD n=1 Tax=Frigidibacter sp. TaxID=2586418 RepID=UPI002735002E|nr:outer membrane lipid asymmetry maintenance protein MlaD [Frigidibacter sp.]MDP3339841.1 outer membrane lipid asymmetry maintenance protein MlaD [Frigidibacter sp.]
MSETRAEILTGAAVLAVALGFAIYAGLGSGLATSSGNYELKASFRSVEGIDIGTDVRLAGVKVGSVTSVALNPATFFADATVAVRSDILLPEDSAILVSSEGLLGGSFIELLPGGSPINLEPGSEIEDTQGAISVVSLMMKFAGGSEDTAPAAGATE